MKLDYFCSKCLARNRVEGFPEETSCGKCSEPVKLAWSEALKSQKLIDACAVCSCPRFYIEKDFPAKIGCAVMAAAVVGFLWTENLFVLLGAAAVDCILYLVLPNRTICYKCLAEYRGWPKNPEHQRYELTIAAQYSTSPRRPS